MGSIDAMIKMLKNNELIKKKIIHFKDTKKVKYINSKLIFKKGSKEDIERTRIKIIKEQRRVLIKKMIIIFISFVIVCILYFYITKTLK